MTSTLLFANNAISTLAGAISNTSITAQLAPGSGALFPNPGLNQYFKLTFIDQATGLVREIVHVTGMSGDTITAMTRGQEGTSAQSYLAGDLAQNLWTAGSAGAMAQIQSIVQSYTVAGTYTFTVPSGINFLKKVRLVGAGGGGSGGQGTATWSSGGGGSGGYSEGFVVVTPLSPITVTVGAGGTGASNGNGATANAGGTTSFGPYMSATGGGGGTGGTSTSSGGLPGLGSGGTELNLYGANGGDGNPGGITGTNGFAFQGGPGGASAFGGGGRTSTVNIPSVINGFAPGSGGGGIWGSGAGAQNGGNGADGAVFIEY